MPLSPENEVRLKKAAIAVAALMGARTVLNFWKDGKQSGMFFRNEETGNFFSVHYQKGYDRITQYSGKFAVGRRQPKVVELEASELTDDDVDIFEDPGEDLVRQPDVEE